MTQAGQLLSAALLRPLNLLALGVGLVLALTWAPWWTFPLSFVPYGLMVFLSLRDSAFAQRVLRHGRTETAGRPLDWRRIGRELGPGPWAAPLDRIAGAERNLGVEVEEASEEAAAILTSTLGQVRSAANLGVELARKLRSLDRALGGYVGMNPEASRSEAAERRRRAGSSDDAQVRSAYLDAASALEESARTADSMRSLRQRLAAQLENLSAMIESIAVRGVRLRMGSESGPGNVVDTLTAEIDAARETLGVLESLDDPQASEKGRVEP